MLYGSGWMQSPSCVLASSQALAGLSAQELI